MSKDMRFEKERVSKLIDLALKHGATYVSLWDGEEWSVKHDPTGQEVIKEMCATDLEILRFFDADKNDLGSFHIAWGEGADNVFNNTDNDWCNSMWNIAGLGR